MKNDKAIGKLNKILEKGGDNTSESIVRQACIKVLTDKHLELAKRSYPPPRILLELAEEMRALKF